MVRRKWLLCAIAVAWLAFAALGGYLIGLAHSTAIEAGGKRESLAIAFNSIAQDNTAADIYAGTADPTAGHAFVKGTYLTHYDTIVPYLGGVLLALGLVVWAAIRRERLAGQLLFMALAGYLIGMAHGTMIAEGPLWAAAASGIAEGAPVDRNDAAVAR